MNKVNKIYINSTKYNIQERQTKNNGKVFDVAFRYITRDGDKKIKKLSGFKTKTEARLAHDEFVTQYCEVVKGNPYKQEVTAENIGGHTVGELFPLYISAMQGQCKESSIYDKQNVFNLFVFPKYKDKRLRELTRVELYRWQDELWGAKNPRTNETYSYKYLCKVRSTFSAFLAWASDRYEYPNNFTTIKLPKRRTAKTEMQFWTNEEFDKFLAVADDPTYKAFFATLFYTGRRKGEILALNPEDVKNNTLRVNKSVTTKTTDGTTYKVTSTKADKTQTLPICEAAQHTLQEYNGNAPFLFGGDKPLVQRTIDRMFEKYTNAAGLKKIRIHDLRHSFVSRLIHLGVNFIVIAELIGDTPEQVIKTYGHLYNTDVKAAIHKLDEQA